jgi:hypothetical protein
MKEHEIDGAPMVSVVSARFGHRERSYTKAKVKPAWSGARPKEIPSWLGFRAKTGGTSLC